MPLTLVDRIHLVIKHITKIPLHDIFQPIKNCYAWKQMPINITIVTYR